VESALEAICRHAAAHGDREAVIAVSDPARRASSAMSYAQVVQEAGAVGSWLAGRARAGDRIALALPSGHSLARALAGCWYAGTVAVPIPVPDTPLHRRRVAGILRDSGAHLLITEADTDDAVRDWVAAEGLPVTVAALPPRGARPPDWQPHPVGPGSLALLQYTSGTTEAPKGVMATHGSLLHNADAVHRALGRPAVPRFGGWGPPYHDMGLAVLLQPMLLGGTAVVMPAQAFLRRPVSWLQLIDAYRVDLSAAPNFAYDLCVRTVSPLRVRELDLSRWAYALNGAEPVNPATLHEFAQWFAPAGLRPEALCPVYGLAESTVYVSGLSPRPPTVTRVDRYRLETGMLERASPGAPAQDIVGCGSQPAVEISIVDPDRGEEVPDGRIGEIWLRGPSVASGYWGRADPAFGGRLGGADGFLHTGDLGARLDGELYVTGRIKDLLIVHGRNLHPHDLERAARTAAAELAAEVGAAFAVGPDERIVLVHEVGRRPDPDRLHEIAESITAAVAREVGVVLAGVVLTRRATVGRTTSGKVQRAATRRRFLAGDLDALYERVDDRVRPALVTADDRR
jgi:acyl-CoA synthetase (AMP-forming)/AMP-acid ligase II